MKTKHNIGATIKTNTPFTVSIPKHNVKFKAICLSTDNGTSTDKNLIKVLSSGSTFPIGDTFTVEDDWFDEGLTGRHIQYL